MIQVKNTKQLINEMCLVKLKLVMVVTKQRKMVAYIYTLL